MAIVIGAATTVSFGTACVISANWGYNPNVQRFYCIGEWEPNDRFTSYKPTENLSLTVYAPSGITYPTEPTRSCADANTVSASVSPAACGGAVTSLYGNWLVNSYSYSKEDSGMAGTETWSLTRWKDLNATPPSNFVEPTYVMRGLSEGQATDNAGIDFMSGTTVETSTGSVAANSMGRADTLQMGIVVRVGGGSSAAGEIGQGSASMQYTPLYI